MSRSVCAPAGFVVRASPAGTLIAARERVEPLEQAGLHRPERWRELLAGPTRGRRRAGTTARLALPGGPTLRLKQLLRGGLLGPLWCERLVGARRALDNLRLPLEAARRGLATPLPLALLLAEGPRGLFRAWLATEEVAPARDLRSLLAPEGTAGRAEVEAAMATVRRMHDLGIEHRDLNAGNLLLRGRPDGGTEAFVVDLDGARLHDRALSFGARQRALRRLERSCAKLGPRGPRTETIRDLCYTLYAGADQEFAARLDRGRRTGRLLVAVHGLLWRR